MNDADRFRLRFGPYKTPRFRNGKVVSCEVPGEVRIVGLSDAPIPWPMGRKGNGPPALIVFGALAKAVRREANLAVAHWWASQRRRSRNGARPSTSARSTMGRST